MRRVITVLFVVLLSFLILSVKMACADICNADLNNDGEVNRLDWQYFKETYKAERGMTDCDSSHPAPVPKTGQTTCYNILGFEIDCTDTGQDGESQRGVEWPNPRFTDNGDGTITDNLTGLIWLKDASCFGTSTWDTALSESNGLASGSCGLADGSRAGDWRLPTYKELFSLIDAENYKPALPSGHPFINVQSLYYWSSTTLSHHTEHAWYVSIDYGGIFSNSKETYFNWVWPVRGGH